MLVQFCLLDLQGEGERLKATERWSKEARTWQRPWRAQRKRRQRIQQQLWYSSSSEDVTVKDTFIFFSNCDFDPDSAAGPLDHEDNHAYAVLETNTETDQTADTDASESNMPANRRRRSRRRRTDEDATLMDGMSESDNASMSENGIGTDMARFEKITIHTHTQQKAVHPISPILSEIQSE